MLLQLEDILVLIINYIPIIVEIGLYIAILVFAIFIFKKNQYKYGLFLILSSIFMLAYYAIYISINFPYLSYTLNVVFGMDALMVSQIMISISFLFMGLRIASIVFLFISVYFIFDSHKMTENSKKED
jgi:hypothetical protein